MSKYQINKLLTVNWNYNDNPEDKQISILEFIDKNPIKYRDKFCEFNYKISNFSIFEKNFNNICKDSKGYNYWQMSNIFEKSFYKSKHINNLIKLFALEDLASKELPSHLQINNLHPSAYKAIKELCYENNIILVNKILSKKNILKDYITTTFFYSLYYLFKQFLLFNSFKLHDSSKMNNNNEKKILIFSYLVNLDKDCLDKNIFYSYNWGDLPKILMKSNYVISWFHHFTKTIIFKDKKESMRKLHSLNKKKAINGMHKLLYEYFNYFTFLKIIFKFIYVRVYFLFFTVLMRYFYFNKTNKKLKFWYIIKHNWYESFLGVELIKNILWIELFENLFKHNNGYEKCIYLFENQSWEKALINGYKRHNNNNILGYLHHTARFWDTRLYFHKDEVKDLNSSYLIMPNKIAVSGSKAKSSLIKSGYNESYLLEVEAIRYLSLIKTNQNNVKKNKDNLIINQKILILGGYISEINHFLLSELLKIDKSKINAHFDIKFHPGCSIDIKKYNDLDLNVVNNNLSDIINRYNSVIITGDSSASIESFFSNINTIVYINANTLNFNPLYPNPNIKFAVNAEDILRSLSEKNISDNSKELKNFLWLDNNLEKWKKIF